MFCFVLFCFKNIYKAQTWFLGADQTICQEINKGAVKFVIQKRFLRFMQRWKGKLTSLRRNIQPKLRKWPFHLRVTFKWNLFVLGHWKQNPVYYESFISMYWRNAMENEIPMCPTQFKQSKIFIESLKSWLRLHQGTIYWTSLSLYIYVYVLQVHLWVSCRRLNLHSALIKKKGNKKFFP